MPVAYLKSSCTEYITLESPHAIKRKQELTPRREEFKLSCSLVT